MMLLHEVGEVPLVSSRGVFINYRREDAAPYARLLKFQLEDRFPDVRVFMDVDSIEPGLEFADVIREALDSCGVLVALIGRQWSTVTDEQGCRRLDDPDDYVRFEVQIALERRVRVIPVLVDGARPLRQELLPADLHRLARLNALELSYGRYEYDAGRLLNVIEQVLAAAPGATIAPESASAARPQATADLHDVQPDGNVRGQTTQEDPLLARNDQARVARVLTEAKRTAESITYTPSKARALIRISRVVVAVDPDRGAALIADAERVAQSIPHIDIRVAVLVEIARAQPTSDPDRTARLIASAEIFIQSISEDLGKYRGRFDHKLKALAGTDLEAALMHSRVNRDRDSEVLSTLAGIVETLAAIDPDGAERVAQSVPYEAPKAIALASVVEALATTDPDRAKHIAQSITDERWKAIALADVAKALAVTDPNGAVWCFADAENVAHSIPDEDQKADAFASVAMALTAIDPDGGERIAQSIPDEIYRARTLADIAKVLAATDPDRAERIAQSITNEYLKAHVLADIVRLLAATDIGRAGRIAESMPPNEYQTAVTLADIVKALAATDPDRAEYIAQSIINESYRAGALADIAKVSAATDPDRAERLIASAESIAQSTTAEKEKAFALTRVAKALAATDPDRAERIAQSITDEYLKADVLADIVRLLAASDPDRAERIARSITDGTQRVAALLWIAQA